MENKEFGCKCGNRIQKVIRTADILIPKKHITYKNFIKGAESV